MDDSALIKLSKRMSRALRHRPKRIGLTLDAGGWVAVTDLLAALSTPAAPVTRSMLDEVVERDDKSRYAFDASGGRIRASQGHTVPVDLGLESTDPRVLLYHGTTDRFLVGILQEGLRPMGRHHVHLSADLSTARRVGARRGRPVVLRVEAAELAASGARFFRSANGVWLTDAVPPGYLTMDADPSQPRPPGVDPC